MILPALAGVLGLAFVLAGCSSIPPFNQRPVVASMGEPPAVLSANSTRQSLMPCPPPLIAQTQWLGRNMARVRLGYNKLQVVSTLGDPANSETFGLTNGAVVEVLYYHTPDTVCRINARSGNADGLMPLVFQDDRLLGYGQTYYRQFILPMLRQAVAPAPVGAVFDAPQGMPQPRAQMIPAEPLQPAPARTGRLMQEDLPGTMPGGQGSWTRSSATPPAANYDPTPVARDGNGYTGGMNDMYPVNYVPSSGSAVGRGEPLR